jgi:RimJ/RimL family protein N-acetyltransferase
MENFPAKLSTERLTLEPLTAEWLDQLLEENHGNVARYSVRFADRDQVHSWLTDCRQRQERQERLGMAVLTREGRKFLGVASIQSINIDPQLGIWISEQAQGRGYGQESVQCLIDWYKLTYGHSEKIKYLAEKGNIASIKLAWKLGMKRKGKKINPEGVVFEEFQL